jgi:hypothetical protein
MSILTQEQDAEEYMKVWNMKDMSLKLWTEWIIEALTYWENYGLQNNAVRYVKFPVECVNMNKKSN